MLRGFAEVTQLEPRFSPSEACVLFTERLSADQSQGGPGGAAEMNELKPEILGKVFPKLHVHMRKHSVAALTF